MLDWKKFLAFKSCPDADTYGTLPDDITWLRIFFSIAYGISLTYRDLTPSDSALAIIMGMNIIMFLPVIWLNFFLNAKTDSYKNLNFQGVPNALAMMMLIWIISFTAAHEEDEKLFAKALIEPIVKLATGEEMRDESVTMEESEF